MPGPVRLTIGFDETASEALEAIKGKTHLAGASDVVRAAMSVFSDLLSAEDKGYQVILRGSDGRMWAYSPHRRGRAIEIKNEDLNRQLSQNNDSEHFQSDLGPLDGG